MPADSYDALVPYGWSDRVLALHRSVDAPGCRPGRVVRVERATAVVVGPDGTERLLASDGYAAVGDWVSITDSGIHAVLPRWSALARVDPSDALQVLAADVDLVVVTAPADRPSPNRIERELALVWESGATPLVVVTKADLAAAGIIDDLQRRLISVEVLPASVVTGQNLDVLRARLQPGVTAVLLGPSGAGKSTLVNALLGSEALATGAVREADGRGRHTTTARQLIALPGGGVIIDTPGLRSLALTGDDHLDQVFPEIEELAASCRFRDCRHDAEPGCAVTAAVSAGTLSAARLASFRKLARELAFERRRSDVQERRLERQIWKQRTKQARARRRS